MGRARLVDVVDVVVVAALAATSLAQIRGAPAASLDGGWQVHAVLVAAFTLPLLARRRFAFLVLVTVVAASWLQFELGAGLGQPFFAVLLALYSVGAHAPMPWTLAGPTVTAALIVLDVSRLRDGAPVDEVVPAWFVLGGVWGFGRWMRHRAEAHSSLAERAATAERDAAARARQAVHDERERIARELHDLVAHSMGVIVIQAQGAQRAIDTNPERALSAMAAIETTGRNGLAEMRRLLGLLTGDDTSASTAPQPSLSGVPDLVGQIRATGMPVDLAVAGDIRPLPPGIELAGYRVVQEALTNTLKHSPSARLEVRIGYEPSWLDICVSDDGPRTELPPRPTGRGLVGMHERVALYGGTVVAGPGSAQGFEVHARLPLDWHAA